MDNAESSSSVPSPTLRLKALLEEYKNLAGAIERASNIPFACLVFVGAVAVAFAGFEPTSSRLTGVAIAYALAFAMCWVGYVYSLCAGLCLRVVRLELLINRVAELDHDEVICWYSMGSGTFVRPLPAYRIATLCTVLLGGTVLVLSLVGARDALREHFELPDFACLCIVAIPVLTTLAQFVTMFFSEHSMYQKKLAIFKEFGVKASDLDYKRITLYPQEFDTNNV